MAETPAGWREKYLNALDTQEQLEQQLSHQQEVLRRCLIHLGAAVAGQDSELETAIKQLKDRLRQAPGPELGLLLERVEHHLLLLESFQEDQRARLMEIVYQCCQQLKTLQLPSSLRHRIHQLASNLQQQHATYEDTLNALELWRSLLQDALAEAASPQTNFWQRIRGGRALRLEDSDAAPVATPFTDTAFFQPSCPKPRQTA